MDYGTDEFIQKVEAIDLDLMKKIQDLIDSRSSENKHKALDLIEREDTRLSGFYAMNFFGSLIFDPEDAVKKRSRKIMDSKIGPKASKNLEESVQKLHAIRESWKNLSFNANMMSTAFDTSHNIAKIIRHSLTIPINSITLSPVFEMVKSQQEMFKSLAIPAANIPKFSPILESTAFVSRISEVADTKLTIPQAMGRSIPEIEKELDAVIESDEDVIFNYEGYKILYNLERFLRDLIKQRICLKNPKLIPNRIPQQILDRWKSIRDEEKRNPYVSGDYDLIDYSDFTDLKMIFEKGKNIQLFRDICSEDQFRAIISKLNELDPIRKKIAHSRPLQKKEFDRLKMCAEDINRILNRC